MRTAGFYLIALLLSAQLYAAEPPLGTGFTSSPNTASHTNHEGRALPKLPEIKAPVMFNTPEADAICSALQVFPKNNAWNEDISKLPVLPDSEKIIASIGKDKTLGINMDMGFILVPPTQNKVPANIKSYPKESDKGPFPIPDNAPVENWPLEGGTLDNAQRKGDGDRHVIVVDPVNGKLHEFYQGRKTDAGWECACEATFDLFSNTLRPKGWTSSDAAGLPIFPAIVRFDEVERGKVEHALRFTVKRSRKLYIYPATHQAGRSAEPTLPAMGQRVRLKSSVDISKFPKHAQAVAYAMQKYGMIVADNGGDWRISVAPDSRIKGLNALTSLKGSDFEVVQTTGELEGPRK